MKKYRIDLPAKAVENLELEKNTSLVLMVDNKTLTIRPSRTVEMLPQIMMRWYLIPAVLAAVIFFCLSWSNHHWVISLTGNWSIGFASLYLGTFSGVVAFATAFIRQKKTSQWASDGAALAKSADAADCFWNDFGNFDHDCFLARGENVCRCQF